MDILAQILFILFIGVLFFIDFKAVKANIFAPWLITNAVWLFIVIMFSFYGNMLNPLTGPFNTSLFLWLLGFNIFSILSFMNGYNTKDVYSTDEENIGYVYNEVKFNNISFNLILLLCCIITPLFLYKVYQLLGTLSPNVFFDARNLQNEGEFSFGGLHRIHPILQAMLVISLFNYNNVGKWRFTIVLLLNILMSLAVAEKGAILFILMSVAYCLYERKILTARYLLFGALSIIGLFYGMQVIRGGENYEASFDNFLAIYVLSPSVAFETLNPSSSPQFGACTFPPLYIVLNSLFDTNYEIILKLKDFVYVPLRTNVFTVMQPFYEDFGYLGVFSFGGIYGFLSTYIYKKSINGSIFLKCVYAYVLYTLINQFFQENFFVSISYFLQLCLVYYLVLVFKADQYE